MTFGRSEIHFVNPIFGAKSTGEQSTYREEVRRGSSLWVGECMYQLSILAETQAKTGQRVRGDRLSFTVSIRDILMGLHKLSDFGSIPLDVQPKHRGFLPRHLAIWAYATFDLFSLATGLISMIWDISKGCTILTGRVLPSRELTYLALRKGTSSSKVTLNGKDVSSHEGF